LRPRGSGRFGGTDGNIQCKSRVCLKTDEMDVVRAAVAAGLGISILPVYMAGNALQQGQLVPLLRQFQVLPESAIYLVHLPNRTLSSRVRALIDFLAERFGPIPSWEVGW
jgi:DNA-binding transcriptional LysR family regulator